MLFFSKLLKVESNLDLNPYLSLRTGSSSRLYVLCHLMVEIIVVLLESDNLFFNILNKWYFIVYCLVLCHLFGIQGKSFIAQILIYISQNGRTHSSLG